MTIYSNEGLTSKLVDNSRTIRLFICKKLFSGAFTWHDFLGPLVMQLS